MSRKTMQMNSTLVFIMVASILSSTNWIWVLLSFGGGFGVVVLFRGTWVVVKGLL